MFRVGGAAKAALLRQLRADLQLLQRLNLTDYKLLVGVHSTRREATLRDQLGIVASSASSASSSSSKVTFSSPSLSSTAAFKLSSSSSASSLPPLSPSSSSSSSSQPSQRPVLQPLASEESVATEAQSRCVVGAVAAGAGAGVLSAAAAAVCLHPAELLHLALPPIGAPNEPRRNGFYGMDVGNE